jgi:hypothetical protein
VAAARLQSRTKVKTTTVAAAASRLSAFFSSSIQGFVRLETIRKWTGKKKRKSHQLHFLYFSVHNISSFLF